MRSAAIALVTLGLPLLSCAPEGGGDAREVSAVGEDEGAALPAFAADIVVAFLAHTGPEDKPFPLVVVSARERERAEQEIHDPPFPIAGASYLRLPDAAVERMLAYVRSIEPASARGYGTFRLDLVEPEQSFTLLLDRVATRGLLELVREPLAPDSPEAAVIDGLRNRLRGEATAR